MTGLMLGLIGGGVSGLATTLGGAPILIKDSKLGKFLKSINMDFVIGLMLSAAAFSLIWPAYEKAYLGNERMFQFFLVSLALVGGVIFIKAAGKFLEYVLRHNITKMRARIKKRSFLLLR